MTIELNSANFNQEVLESDQPVVVDFWAPWCPPCRALAPTIDKLSTSLEGKAKVCKLNIEANHDLAVKYDVSSIPVIVFFKDGVAAKRLTGLQSEDAITECVNALD